MKTRRERVGACILCAVWVLIAGALLGFQHLIPPIVILPSGLTLWQLIGLVASVLALLSIARLMTDWLLSRQHKPLVESQMLGRIYSLVAILGIALSVAYGLGKLSAFGAFFSLFGGMILGWSLQAPISGFAAWVLVSLKRPFRPGDRVQFPSLGLTGDVMDMGPMYTVLNQVGGAIGSEEAVGRHILIPNAMLFSQVAINYTVTQEAAYMLDEVVVRITYDSDWEAAEQILLSAATEVTQDVIEATGAKPYIRSDLYDYGVYMRLRYQTRVKDRAKTAYQINKRIFRAIQCTSRVDLAIPYIYSYKSGVERKEAVWKEHENVREIAIQQIRPPQQPVDPDDVAQLAQSIATQGLLQPIVVRENPDGSYDVLAGHLRLEACRQLGWATIRAIIRQPAKTEATEAGARVLSDL